MEYLTRRGTPHRQAHHLVGEMVRRALNRGVRLCDFTVADFQEFDPSLDETVFDVLGVDNAIKAFVSYGSTAPEQVEQQVKNWKDKLAL